MLDTHGPDVSICDVPSEEPVRVISQDSRSNKQHEEESNHGAGSSHPYGLAPKVGILRDWLKWQLSTERRKVRRQKRKAARESVEEIYGHNMQVEYRAAQEGRRGYSSALVEEREEAYVSFCKVFVERERERAV